MAEKPSVAFKCSRSLNCEDFKHDNIDVEITDEQLEKFRQDYRVMPLFEQKIRDFVDLERTSLVTNKLLACRWQERVCTIEKYQKKIFKLPRLRDMHYRNYHIRYLPQCSPDNKPNTKLHMHLGPGVDQYGQLPVPSDLPSVNRKPVCRIAQIKSGRKKHDCLKSLDNDCVERKLTKL